MPSRQHSSTVARTLCVPRRCPSTRGKPRCSAQRPLPSMMMAICAGNREGSRPTAASRCNVSSEISEADGIGPISPDGLLSIRSYGDDAYRQAEQFLEPVHVAARAKRQIGLTPYLADIDRPTGQRLEYRLASFQQEGITWEIVNAPAIKLIACANADFFQVTEHVQQHHG